MYIPAHFREDRLPVLYEAIRSTRLVTLVTAGAEGMEASHIPIALDSGAGHYGAISGHLSRGNLQWRRADPAHSALAIVLGPDAYVTPSWYKTKQDTGKVVPTWNYLAIHAYGTVTFFDDRERLLALVTALTEKHESHRAQPWAVSDAPADYIDAMLKGIIGFTLEISRLEGKWKMSQNRSPDDRAGVVAGLATEGDERSALLLKEMLR